MNLIQWLKIYEDITDSLGINRNEDLISSFILSNYINSNENFLKKYHGKNFFIVGNGKNMPDGLNSISGGVVIVADSAVTRFHEYASIKPDIIVTDMDGDINLIHNYYKNGTDLIIHAHGDNINKILKYSSKFPGAMGTTQNIPIKNIKNYFGFTDGDRSAFLANYLNASSIILIGFCFKEVTIKPYYDENSIAFKKKKLFWARKLLEILASERHKKFIESSVIEI